MIDSSAAAAARPGIRFDGLVVMCADPARSAAFYSDALGLVQDWADEHHIAFHLPTAGNPTGAWLLLHPRTEATVTPYELGTFGVDDVDAAVDRIARAGFPITRQPEDAPWGVREAAVRDPDGYGLTLTSPLSTGA